MSQISKSLTKLYVNEKGQCQCGAVFNSRTLWYIGCQQDVDPTQIQYELEQSNLHTCTQCGQQTRFLVPVLIDHLHQHKASIFVPQPLAYKALSIQSELLSYLSHEATVQAQQYYSQAEIVIVQQALATPVTHAEIDQKSTHSALGHTKNDLDKEIGKTKEAPVIAPIPQALQNSVLESAELAQELAESPTQVIKPKSKHSVSKVEQEIAKTSPLDALIDTALEDHTVISDLEKVDFNTQPTDVKERKETIPKKQSTRSLPPLQAKPSDELNKQDNEQNQKTMISLVEPEEMLNVNHKEPTKRLYAQNMKRFDEQMANQHNKYINVIDGQVELAIKIDERRVDRWINEDLDIRIQLHRELQLGAPCLTIFTTKDGNVQDELYWPIHIDGSMGPKALRSLRKNFKVELVLFKADGQFYGQRMIEAPLEENCAYIINYVKQMGMTSSIAAKARAIIAAEDFDREGQMKHPFNQNSFSDIENAKDAQLAVSIWSYWSTVRQRDYLIFVKSFPIPWLRRLQHRVLKSAIEFGIHMPLNLQSQAVALGLAKSDVELLQKSMTHFVEVNLNFRASGLDSIETWENWDALLAQLSQMGIDADEEVEQLAFQAMQKAGVDLEFEDEAFGEEALTNSEALPHPISEQIDGSDFDSLDDISEIHEVSELEASDEQDVPPPVDPELDSDFPDDEEAELIMEDFIEEEYLTDIGGDAFLLIDDNDIIEEDIIDPKTAEIGDQLAQTGSFEIKTQMFVSQNDEADSDHSSSEG